jgi:16S rRNA (cytidine1402-2'-O)-methyltransferase
VLGGDGPSEDPGGPPYEDAEGVDALAAEVPPRTPGRGAIVLVATPIGNLGDLSERARHVLATAHVIACEDTRRTGRLLQLAGIGRRPMVVVNDHTEAGRAEALVARAGRGEVVALVSDAGTPGISDPGARVVRAAVDVGVDVEAVPGPTALATALVVSGLPTDRFVFEGFLPRKGGERAARLAELAGERRTAVLYEAPHRVLRTLDDLAGICGGHRRVAVCRELTKLHEDVWRGTLAEAVEALSSTGPRGEHVLVLGGAEPPAEADDEAIRAALAAERAAGSSTRDAVAAVVERLGAPKRRVYALATDHQDD